jgi:2,3-bisphosphoglycerate-dependent phosphoglycerate mutase
VTLRIHFIRHAKPDFASREFFQTSRGRQWNPGLGDRGREQAQALAARLVVMETPARVFVSPFRRCRETIQPFLDETGIKAETIEDIGEVFVGAWEGMSFEEIVSGDEELARRFRDQEAMFSTAPGGESGAELRTRVLRAVEKLVADTNDGPVLIVTHGGVINAYIGHVLGLEQDMFFLPDYASINTVRIQDGVPDVRFLNDVRHVTEPDLFVRRPSPDE